MGQISRKRGAAPLMGAGLLILAMMPAMAQDTPPAPQVEPPAAPAVEAPSTEAPQAPALTSPPASAPTAPRAETPVAPAADSALPGEAPPAPQPAANQSAAQSTGQSTPADPSAPTGNPGAGLAVPAPPVAAQQAPGQSAGQPAGAPASEATLPHDLSPWGMFMAADIVVKSVMVGLLIASLVTWTVWLAKQLEIFGARARVRKARARLNDCGDLAEAYRSFEGQRGVIALMVRATHEESRASAAALPRSGGDGLKERVGSHLGRIEAEAGRRMTRGTSILATIGSTAPFVGLFGTVWGIMNSFIGISQSQTTNLAVVAPGIAEALLATAMGLVAAIPAVVIYNHFARSITGYRQQLADVAAGLERMVSRDLDHGRLRAFDLAAE
ncbi:tonB-system energizer ExbB [Amaricoccus sp. W119]|uniref:tonB-system energizer ExbB n=1 Tax=Amaricoccus sp. W119 TaxID=3391833 RepID=UPI0039A57CA2